MIYEDSGISSNLRFAQYDNGKNLKIKWPPNFKSWSVKRILNTTCRVSNLPMIGQRNNYCPLIRAFMTPLGDGISNLGKYIIITRECTSYWVKYIVMSEGCPDDSEIVLFKCFFLNLPQTVGHMENNIPQGQCYLCWSWMEGLLKGKTGE